MGGCRVLVVEDEPDIVVVIGLVLDGAGHVMDAAETLADGHRRLAAVPVPQVLIVDRRLPDGDGLELVRAVRARPRQVPVLVLSAVVSEEALRAAIEAGASRVMSKPFEPAALESAVDDLCRQAAPPAPHASPVV